MTQTLNLCQQCATKHKQPQKVEVLPQYTCSYCQKGESEILYMGQPSCLKCQNKLSIVMDSKIASSQHGCQKSSHSNSNALVINRKVIKQGGQHKIMKKVSDVLNGFTFSKTCLSKLKNVIFYWSKQNGKQFKWSDFMDKIQKQSPLVFVIQVQQQIIGVFMSQRIQKKKGSTEDKYCGCFEITNNVIEFSQLQKNKFVVRHEKHIICYGSPGSVHIIFDLMEIEAEYFKDTFSHPIEHFAVIKL